MVLFIYEKIFFLTILFLDSQQKGLVSPSQQSVIFVFLGHGVIEGGVEGSPEHRVCNEGTELVRPRPRGSVFLLLEPAVSGRNKSQFGLVRWF